MKYNPSEEELRISDEIQRVYNSGQMSMALGMSIEFFRKYPESPLAKYDYAVYHGDCAGLPNQSQEEKDRLLKIAKEGIKDLYEDPERSTWPVKFAMSIRNEYYWFFSLPEKQYELGLEKNQGTPGTGDYSACVGASMMAHLSIREGNVQAGEKWAKTSIQYFHEFEKKSPNWFNINYFAALSFACLGEYDQAVECFLGMYRKQRGPEKPEEIEGFRNTISEIRKIRAD